MLITITYEGENTQNLGYLLHKNPYTSQKFKVNFGTAYVFYPEVSDKKTTAALLLDINSLDLAKGKEGSHTEGLFDYVNDRPYTANSFMSVAINRIFGTAMNGRCDKMQELADTPLNLTATVYMLRCTENELAEELFKPLGYEVSIERGLLDEHFPEWGESPYINLTVKGNVKLSDLLNHLYVLIPVFDGKKHYYINDTEIDKLLEHGGEWVRNHPERHEIVFGYLNKLRSLTQTAINRLCEGDEEIVGYGYNRLPKYHKLNAQRIEAVVQAVLNSGANTVLDLGCGEGKYENILMKQPQIIHITAVDVSSHILKVAVSNTQYHGTSKAEHERIEFIQSSVTYRDERFKNHDCCIMTEVIEHIDEAKFPDMERVVFGFASPETVIVTTPNVEYNKNFSFISDGEFRHTDHRFEWTRQEFRSWTKHICDKFGYKVKITGIGNHDDINGEPTQMGVFTKCK